MARVAFAGLGNMGLPMATRLLDAGHQLSIYNRTAERADSLVRRGARFFDTPRAACEGAEAVLVMVSDDNASRAIWLEHDGVLAATHSPNALAIECSTLSHDWVMQLASQAAARGLRYIDSPVTGLPDTAAQGSITLLVGASEDDLNAASSILGALSARIIRFGPVGAGTAYKLIINMIGAVQIASLAEGLAISERAGLDSRLVEDAFATSQAASPQVIRNTRRMTAGNHEHDIVFTSALRLKDVEYGVRLARKLSIGSPFGELAERIFKQLCELGHAHVNESKVIDVCRSLSPR